MIFGDKMATGLHARSSLEAGGLRNAEESTEGRNDTPSSDISEISLPKTGLPLEHFQKKRKRADASQLFERFTEVLFPNKVIL